MNAKSMMDRHRFQRRLQQRLGAAPIFVCAMLSLPAYAMQFKVLAFGPDSSIIQGLGSIIDGDLIRLRRAVEIAEQKSGRVVALTLDSPGGSLAMAAGSGDFIRGRHFPVVLPSGSLCASACFFLFAAANTRIAAPGALLGVHEASAAPGGAPSATGTFLERKYLEQLQIPSSIIERMAQTDPKKPGLVDAGGTTPNGRGNSSELGAVSSAA